jgi:two-component system, chemotaxis family, chemotaxis protein CheY
MPADMDPVNETQGRQLRVLVADDASGMRTYLRSILAGANYDVTEAADGAEAFDAILRERFDLAFLDLDMPVMDGFQLLSAISLLPRSKGRPAVVICSGLLDEDLATRRPELRLAQVLLAKPVQPDDVLKATEKALRSRLPGC